MLDRSVSADGFHRGGHSEARAGGAWLLSGGVGGPTRAIHTLRYSGASLCSPLRETKRGPRPVTQPAQGDEPTDLLRAHIRHALANAAAASLRRWSRPEYGCPLGTAVVPCCLLLHASEVPQGVLWGMSHLTKFLSAVSRSKSAQLPRPWLPTRGQPSRLFLAVSARPVTKSCAAEDPAWGDARPPAEAVAVPSSDRPAPRSAGRRTRQLCTGRRRAATLRRACRCECGSRAHPCSRGFAPRARRE